MRDQSGDYLIIGAGIAGASAAYELAKDANVILIEKETQLAYHSTGRSAAIYMQAYGNKTVRGLTKKSYEFYTNPPKGFSDKFNGN
ncbi:FAD-dependent oxidoreductase [Lysinibacillus sp. NPDC094177]|uniref:FAD-dependent oxidoreductase n=1 Tax=Lysinibacillus sp. NPDC094177 TaxID=3390580 RepID=UPI003CFF9E2F